MGDSPSPLSWRERVLPDFMQARPGHLHDEAGKSLGEELPFPSTSLEIEPFWGGISWVSLESLHFFHLINFFGIFMENVGKFFFFVVLQEI